MAQTSALKARPLNEVHRRMGAKMVDFGGWDMPVQYTSLLEEHHTVRTAAGIFDVSHMGELVVRGPQARQLVDYISTNATDRVQNGQAHCSGLLYPQGGFVDDILVHKVADTEFFICVNAANQDKDFAHIQAHNHFQAEVENAGPRYAQIALQGPLAAQILPDFASLKYYWFADGQVFGVPVRVARTGYTGEDGFEIYCEPGAAVHIWNALLAQGAKPCGLGARNTLRLEAKMALYGHEIDATTTPLDAGLDWIVKLDKGDFIGRQALQRHKQSRKLVGFEMTGRGIGRDGYEVLIDGIRAGWVTSGCPSPTLAKNIGLCYLPVEHAQPGQRIQVVVRGQAVDAITVPTPFYRRKR